MKTVFRVLTVVSTLSFVLFFGSCSKDNDPKPADQIVGNWTISTVNVAMKVGDKSLVDYLVSLGLPSADAQSLAAQLSDGFESIDGTIEFKKGGTYSSTSAGTTETGTWELTSDGKTLTMDKGTADAFAFTVTTLTSTDLKLSGDQSETDNGLTFTVHLDMALTK